MNKKTGLEYFPFDVDIFQDEKIQFISARFGTKGEAIVIRLLCKIYRQGYSVFWDDDMALLFAKSVGDGCQHSLVKDVVSELLKRDFFDKNIFERFSILTSRGIQRRYFEASIRRKSVSYRPNSILISMEKYSNAVSESQDENIYIQNVDILKDNADILPQSKVKESKVEESKVNQIEDTNVSSLYGASSAPDHAAVIFLTLNDKSEYPILQNQIGEWAELYPAVDILKEIRKMCGWLEGNPKKRKTKAGILKFIHRWLGKAQDMGGDSNTTDQRFNQTSGLPTGNSSGTRPTLGTVLD